MWGDWGDWGDWGELGELGGNKFTGSFAFSFLFPFPRKRESPCLLTVLKARCQKTVRDSGRFPLSREWGCGGIGGNWEELGELGGNKFTGSFAFSFLFPFPRKRESPCLLTVLKARCRKTVRDSGRFPLSREWGCGGIGGIGGIGRIGGIGWE